MDGDVTIANACCDCIDISLIVDEEDCAFTEASMDSLVMSCDGATEGADTSRVAEIVTC